MKIVINEKLVKRNKTLGQIFTFTSMAVLVGGLVLAFRTSEGPQINTILSYAALILGFIFSQIGIYFSNRFGRTPRLDQVISQGLEKLSDNYSLFVYHSPVPLLLVGPAGLWIPIPVTATGKISYLKGKWRQQGGGALMKVFGQEGIGKPEIDDATYRKDLHKYFQSKYGDNFDIPKIQSILVTMMKNTEIGDVSEAPLPVIGVDKLKRYIRHYDRESTTLISEEELAKIKFTFEVEPKIKK